jgi:Fe-S cluster assembly protein SufD
MMPKNSDLSKEITYVDAIPEKASFLVPEEGSLKLLLASFGKLKDLEIEVSVKKNGTFQGAFADFSSFSGKVILNVRLLGEGASCDWHLASMASKEEKKSFLTSVIHEAPHTTARMSNYGIAREKSFLTFAGTSEILHGSRQSVTRQDAKIIVFDCTADGLASPILKISENDVDASHAAVVGRLNEEHLFYLESRGIGEEEAKRLIALGYLKPIENFFSDQSLVARIDSAIEGGI